jgi:hypothetical protein
MKTCLFLIVIITPTTDTASPALTDTGLRPFIANGPRAASTVPDDDVKIKCAPISIPDVGFDMTFFTVPFKVVSF